MNSYAKAAMKRTGKPYGGHLNHCTFGTKNILGIAKCWYAIGKLTGDPAGRFLEGAWIRTSYLVKQHKTYLETLNTIYTYKKGETDETC